MSLRGSMHRGHRGSAGGLAHTRVVVGADGRTCHCGDRDCVEAWSSGWGLRSRPGGGAEGPSDEELRGAGHQLGRSTAQASRLLGPERVIVALLPELDRGPYIDGVRAGLEEGLRFAPTARPALEIAAARGDDIARGAASSIVGRVFEARAREEPDLPR